MLCTSLLQPLFEEPGSFLQKLEHFGGHFDFVWILVWMPFSKELSIGFLFFLAILHFLKILQMLHGKPFGFGRIIRLLRDIFAGR